MNLIDRIKRYDDDLVRAFPPAPQTYCYGYALRWNKPIGLDAFTFTQETLFFNLVEGQTALIGSEIPYAYAVMTMERGLSTKVMVFAVVQEVTIDDTGLMVIAKFPKNKQFMTRRILGTNVNLPNSDFDPARKMLIDKLGERKLGFAVSTYETMQGFSATKDKVVTHFPIVAISAYDIPPMEADGEN